LSRKNPERNKNTGSMTTVLMAVMPDRLPPAQSWPEDSLAVCQALSKNAFTMFTL
jgi:hypothetical protein